MLDKNVNINVPFFLPLPSQLADLADRCVMQESSFQEQMIKEEESKDAYHNGK